MLYIFSKFMDIHYSPYFTHPHYIRGPPNNAVFRRQIFHPKTIFEFETNTNFVSQKQCFEFQSVSSHILGQTKHLMRGGSSSSLLLTTSTSLQRVKVGTWTGPLSHPPSSSTRSSSFMRSSPPNQTTDHGAFPQSTSS